MSGEPIVLHVLEGLEGGTARHLVDLVRHVPAEHHVAIPTQRRGGLTDRAAAGDMTAAGATVHPVAMRRRPWSPANLSAARELRRVEAAVRPDVVHVHSTIGALVGRSALWRRPVPIVFTPNGLPRVRPWLVVERALAHRTARLIAVSPSEAAHLARHVCPSDKVVVVPNGIELDASGPPIDLRAQLGIPRGAPVIGTIARLVDQKAPEDFVAVGARLLARRPEAHAVLIGGGPLESRVHGLVAASGVEERFHLVRELEGARRALPSFDVFVLTSRFEGGPYAPLEAMAARVPVVLTDVIGSRDCVVDGQTGRLAPVHDVDRLVACVEQVLDEPARTASLVAGASEALRTTFDVRVMGERTAAVYAAVSGGEG